MNPSTLIGFAAATLTTLAFLPQVLHTLKSRDTKGLSLAMYGAFSAGVFLWLIYGVMLREWPIIIANGITFLLAMSVLVLKLRHG
ncbi:MAG: SemiSWEET transporter [Gammaproteobacteria bacterium]|nr:SemiSWEET family sugar transporter [Gammaproteobacteria bacterium]MCP5138164.1 SemiSWEET transporter [Gammaproteobacteria bacterium]